MKRFFNFTALALVASLGLSSIAQAEEIRVMTSGGFTAAYKILGPKFAESSGNTLDTALGPSMGKAPEAIPNRLARGEKADVVIMVGYALDDLIKQGKVDPASRVELADSRIGMVVREGAPKPDISSVEGLKKPCSTPSQSPTPTVPAACISRINCSSVWASKTSSNPNRR